MKRSQKSYLIYSTWMTWSCMSPTKKKPSNIKTVKEFWNDIWRSEAENIIINGDEIKELEQERTYKYLGIEKSEKMENIMKSLKTEYRRIKSINPK